MKPSIILALLLLLTGCAQIAESAVNAAIKHCMTFDGFSKARNSACLREEHQAD